MRVLRIVAAGIVIGSTLFVVGPAAASRPTSSYYFYDCVGDGPTDFWAVKTGTPAVSGAPVSAGSSLDLTDGSGTYQILSYGDGNADPPGIRGSSSSYNLVCLVDYTSGTTTVYGHFSVTP